MGAPIQRRKIYEEILDRLMGRIGSGEIPAGAQLPSERELMDEYGVGRPAVREALQALQRSGIVEITHGERARVVVPTPERLVAQVSRGVMHLLRSQPDSLAHLNEVRAFLECGMAGIAAARATEEQVARLRLVIAQQRSAKNSVDLFAERDMAFHREIAGISGNPIFPVLAEALHRWAGESGPPLVRTSDADDATLAEHARIVDAIARRDAAAASAAMRAHLTRARTR